MDHERTFQSINGKTILIVCNLIIRATDFVLSEAEWIFDNLKNKVNLIGKFTQMIMIMKLFHFFTLVHSIWS